MTDTSVIPPVEGMEVSLNARPTAVAKNAVYNYVTLGLGALIGFVVTPIMLSSLGTTAFGVWWLILGTVGYLSLLEAGLGFATITRVAALEAKGASALNTVLATSLGMCLCIAAVGMLITAALAIAFPALFDVPADLADDARIALLLVGAWQMFGFVLLVLTASLVGTGRMYLVTLSGSLVSALASAAQAVALLSGGGLRSIAAIQLVGGIVTIAVFRWQLRRVLPTIKFKLRAFDRPTAKRLLGLGWRNSVYSVASVLAFGSDVILVGLLLDAKAAAAFAIALRAYTLLRGLSMGVLSAIGPAHSHAAHHSTAERRFRLYCLATLATLCLAAFGALTVGLFASPLLNLWLGDFPAEASTILVVLCAVLILHTPGYNAAALLLASEQAGELMRITLLAAGINVLASIVFTLTAGSIGPALGSLVAVTLVDAVYLPLRICRMLGQPYSELLRRVLLPLALPVSLLIGVLLAGKVVAGSGVWVLAVTAAGALAYFVTLWHTSTGREVRLLLRSKGLAAT
jgi:O-antigen/teichoic acid export membrane protein